MTGPLVGSDAGMRAVFLGTSVLMAIGVIFNLVVKRPGALHDAGRNAE
jgi:hypothetical protein